MAPANWISNGDPVPPTPLAEGLRADLPGLTADIDSVALETVAHLYRTWRLGRYEFKRSRRRGLWTVQTAGGTGRMCGAAGYRTPLMAFLATWRIVRRG